MAQATKTTTGVIRLKCNKSWTDCQKKQFCAKVRHMNYEAKKAIKAGNGGLWWRPLTPKMRRQKKTEQAKYRRNNQPPQGEYYNDCAKYSSNEVQADHKRDVQMGGNVKGPFKYLDASVNTTIGSDIDKLRPRPRPATGFTAPGCC